jgi:hypothetical protein
LALVLLDLGQDGEATRFRDEALAIMTTLGVPATDEFTVATLRATWPNVAPAS